MLREFLFPEAAEPSISMKFSVWTWMSPNPIIQPGCAHITYSCSVWPDNVKQRERGGVGDAGEAVASFNYISPTCRLIRWISNTWVVSVKTSLWPMTTILVFKLVFENQRNKTWPSLVKRSELRLLLKTFLNVIFCLVGCTEQLSLARSSSISEFLPFCPVHCCRRSWDSVRFMTKYRHNQQPTLRFDFRLFGSFFVTCFWTIQHGACVTSSFAYKAVTFNLIWVSVMVSKSQYFYTCTNWCVCVFPGFTAYGITKKKKRCR